MGCTGSSQSIPRIHRMWSLLTAVSGRSDEYRLSLSLGVARVTSGSLLNGELGQSCYHIHCGRDQHSCFGIH